MCNAWNHPSWCQCGFGGEGHLGGHGTGGGSPLFDFGRRQRWRTEDFCRRMPCPKCSKNPIYLIRHNGGTVYVEHLGLPWTRHPCFDSTNQKTDPFQLHLFDPPPEIPHLGIIVQTTHDAAGARLHLELRLESGKLGSIECNVPNSPEGLNGSLIFVYLKSQQIRCAPLGILYTTRLDVCDANSVVSTTPTVETEPPKAPEVSHAAGNESLPPGHDSTMPLRRTGLNWSERELMQWEIKIVEEVAGADDFSTAKHLAIKKIDGLSRPLRNLLRQRFDRTKWRQVIGGSE